MVYFQGRTVSFREGRQYSSTDKVKFCETLNEKHLWQSTDIKKGHQIYLSSNQPLIFSDPTTFSSKGKSLDSIGHGIFHGLAFRDGVRSLQAEIAQTIETQVAPQP